MKLSKYWVQVFMISGICAVIIYIIYGIGDNPKEKAAIVTDLTYFGATAFGATKLVKKPKEEATDE